MDREEFETYLNANSRAVALFRSRALSHQHSQNRKRAASKQWNEAVINSAVNRMVEQFIDNVYEKLRTSIKESKLHPYDSWVNFIETYEVMDSLEDSIAESLFSVF